jgi:hypothetical protein
LTAGVDSASCLPACLFPTTTYLPLPPITASAPQFSPHCCLLCLQRNEQAAKEGTPLQLFWRRQYVPTEGMFCDPPTDMQLGTRMPEVRSLLLLLVVLLGLDA